MIWRDMSETNRTWGIAIAADACTLTSDGYIVGPGPLLSAIT
jgi:hypothetical protein